MTDAPKKPIIQIQNVTKRFGRVAAVDNVSLDILAGEFFVLLGPSGCGKTTLLRMIAGFELPTEGTILIDGQDMAGIPPNKRPVNMVFQSYAVFPHMSVADNVAYGLKIAGMKGGEVRDRVAEALDLVKLGGFEDRMPDQMSGGQRQRVALARALAIEPRLLLLDEPFGALDAKVRKDLRRWLRDLHKQMGLTSIFVTHDQEEALELADRVVVMNQGRIEQIGAPDAVYMNPETPFVSHFVGETNRLPAPGGEIHFRPHEITLAADGAEALLVDNVFRKGAVWRAEGLLEGSGQFVELDLPSSGEAPRLGQTIRFNPHSARMFNADGEKPQGKTR